MTAITNWIELFSSPTPAIDSAFKTYESYKAKILNPASNYEKAVALIYVTSAANAYITEVHNYYGWTSKESADRISSIVSDVKSLPAGNNTLIDWATKFIITSFGSAASQFEDAKIAFDSHVATILSSSSTNAEKLEAVSGITDWADLYIQAIKNFYGSGLDSRSQEGATLIAGVVNSVKSLPVINSEPTGSVKIYGSTIQGHDLTTINTLSDADGLGTISYQWLSNGEVISGATQNTYTLTPSDVGKIISVKASYTDFQNTAESVTSSVTSPVIGSQSAPTGSVAITGAAQQNQTLSVNNTLADANGLSVVSNQWQSNGVVIPGATQATYALTQSDVGKNISVSASYTDGLGKLESVTSAAVIVSNVNDLPTGSLTERVHHHKGRY